MRRVTLVPFALAAAALGAGLLAVRWSPERPRTRPTSSLQVLFGGGRYRVTCRDGAPGRTPRDRVVTIVPGGAALADFSRDE